MTTVVGQGGANGRLQVADADTARIAAGPARKVLALIDQTVAVAVERWVGRDLLRVALTAFVAVAGNLHA